MSVLKTDPRMRDVMDIYTDGTYFGNNNSWHVEDSPWKAKQIATLLYKNSIYPERVCEVGCGAGAILTELSKTMPKTCFDGYELSPQAYKICKERASDKIRYFHKNMGEEDVFYDCLLCIDVFEHVEDYIGFIKSLRARAKYKIFHIPLDISVRAILRGTMIDERRSVGHLHYFTRDTAIATIKDCGYEIIDGFYTMSFLDMPSKTWRTSFSKLRYKLFYSLFPELTVNLFGSSSYILLAI